MSEPNPLEEFVHEYRDDPVKFVKDVLGATPLPYQAEFLDALGQAAAVIADKVTSETVH